MDVSMRTMRISWMEKENKYEISMEKVKDGKFVIELL